MKNTEEQTMKHLKSISVRKAQDDVFGYIFLQLWLTVFTAMLTAALGEK